MKLSQSLEDRELSDVVLSSMKELIDRNIDEIVEKYNGQLIKNGKRLDAADINNLKKAIRGDKLKIRMTITSNITPKLLEDWDIYPVSLRQSTLTVEEEQGDEGEQGDN